MQRPVLQRKKAQEERRKNGQGSNSCMRPAAARHLGAKKPPVSYDD